MTTFTFTTENMFEVATRLKVRFNFHGTIGPEDLWDLSLKSLDTIYGELAAEVKGTESLMGDKEDKVLELKIALVKHVFTAKKEEAKGRKAAAEKIAQKHRLQEVLVRKQDQKLETLSPEEIQKMIDEL